MNKSPNKAFELGFCTVARWKDGQIVEENLATTRRVDAPGPRACRHRLKTDPLSPAEN
jgi:hypothetical protein